MDGWGVGKGHTIPNSLGSEPKENVVVPHEQLWVFGCDYVMIQGVK